MFDCAVLSCVLMVEQVTKGIKVPLQVVPVCKHFKASPRSTLNDMVAASADYLSLACKEHHK